MENLQIIQYRGQRVLTTAQLAESYGTEPKRIQNNFSENKARFAKGKHYILLTGDELEHFKNDSRNSGLVHKQASQIYLWTEKGAWMHAKSLNTDEAWDAYEMLVDDYYRVTEDVGFHKNLSPEVKAIFFLDKKTQEIESRVERLEVSKTIDYGQQLELQHIAKRQVIAALGGKDGQAYRDKSLRGKVFSAIWKDYKDYFNIESYKNTLVRDLDKAKEYISSWRPQGKLLREIEEANRQMAFA